MGNMKRLDRRDFLVGVGGTAALLAAPGIDGALAQEDPAPLSPLALQQRLSALEAQAGAVGLPAPRSMRPAARITRANGYLEAMPRLLELMERSELGLRSAAVGGGAAELLSRLHRQEYGFARTPGPGPDLRAAPAPDRLRAEYRRMFEACRVRPEFQGAVATNVGRLRQSRARYEKLSGDVQIPWYFVGIIHGLEASFSFMGHLHNGDVLTGRTRNVPRERPKVWLPPTDWEASAKDALDYDGFLGQSDWSLEMMLYRWEAYNGWGYRSTGRPPTPYLWSFSGHYSRGKFASDGRYDPQLRSQQCGAAVMLKELLTAGDVAQI